MEISTVRLENIPLRKSLVIRGLSTSNKRSTSKSKNAGTRSTTRSKSINFQPNLTHRLRKFIKKTHEKILASTVKGKSSSKKSREKGTSKTTSSLTPKKYSSRNAEKLPSFIKKKPRTTKHFLNNLRASKINFFQKIKSKKESRRRSISIVVRQNKNYFKKKYHLLQILGKGSNSSVYLCRNRLSQTLFAVKIIHKKKLKSERHFKNLKVGDRHV